MSRRRNAWISLIAAMLSAALVLGVYRLQLRQIRLQQTVRVAVPRAFIDAGQMLRPDMFKLMPIYRSAYDSGMITDLSMVQGRESLMPLGAGEALLSWKLGRYELLPKQGEATFQIPKPYLLSVADGIRAGDEVAVYVSHGGTPRRLFDRYPVVASVISAGRADAGSSSHSNLNALTEGNREQLYASRLNASSSIEEIDLNLTEAQWLEIDRLCGAGGQKLVIAFTANTLRRFGPLAASGGEGGGG